MEVWAVYSCSPTKLPTLNHPTLTVIELKTLQLVRPYIYHRIGSMEAHSPWLL